MPAPGPSPIPQTPRPSTAPQLLGGWTERSGQGSSGKLALNLGKPAERTGELVKLFGVELVALEQAVDLV
jgi:hypothetical protein